MKAADIAKKHNAGLQKPGIGHNSGAVGEAGLKSFVDRIERLAEERQTFTDDIKDVFAEAKSTGLDVKALRTILKLRKIDPAQRKEAEAVLETYMHALGMLD